MGQTSREGEIFGLLYEKFKKEGSFFVYDMKKEKQGHQLEKQ